MKRCEWVSEDPLYLKYHDKEWGRPTRDDRLLFEMLNLEGAQAGLSWITVLKKRARYKEVFHDFDVELVAKMTDQQLDKLLLDPGIIRNRLKVYGTRKNAIATLELMKEQSLANYLWSWVNDQPKVNTFKTMKEVPASTPLSEKISKDLKKRDFTFVGPTIVYAFMQAVGMVNDHTTDCSFYKDCC